MKSNNDYKQAMDMATQHYFTSSNNLGYASIFGQLASLALRASFIFVTIPISFPLFLVFGLINLIYKSIGKGNREKGKKIVIAVLQKLVIKDGILDLNNVSRGVPHDFFKEIVNDLVKTDPQFKKFIFNQKELCLLPNK
jgi:hypothetical protein